MAESTVHVVDDDKSFLMAMSRLLRASGYLARTYSSAREFFAECCADEPGCVVVDLHMPDLDGLDFQAALAQTPYPLPVLFLTGHADTASTVRAMRGGAEDFLEKTVAKELLLDAVRRALARNQQEREERVHRDQLRARFAAISSREREVLGHVLRGRLNKQIAGDLGIHERTVKVHRKSIMTKLSVRSVAALAQLSQEAGLPVLP
jgi:FixJ family two-component response regulator